MFESLIGQEQIKSRLQFYAEAHNTGSIIPPIMFSGARGLGKTEFAKQFAKAIGKPTLEINCGTIKNSKQFFEQVFMNVIAGAEISVLFDECHALPRDLVEVFLTLFNTEGAKQKEISIEDGHVTVDFTKQNFLFATTELHRIFEPLKDRMTIIDFKQYNSIELSKIIQNKVEWIKYEDGVIEDIVSTVKGNARSAIKAALEIKAYANVKNKSQISMQDWSDLKKILGIRPFGLTNVEVEIMNTLMKNGPCSLQTLSAVTGMSRLAIQREAENNLLRHHFIEIDGKRKITNKGRQILTNI